MTTDRRLVAKGTNEPFQALVDQARYHVRLAEEHAADLAEHNWTQQQTADLVAELAALDTERYRQLDERTGAKQTTRDEGAAISEAKVLITKIRNIVRQVLRKNGDTGVSVDDFHAGGPLGRAASKISEYLARVRIPVSKLDNAFAPYFKQQLLSKLIDDARAKLDAASATQDADIAALPEDTAVVYERKGRLLEHIEDLNAIARNAFHDAPETRAKFNKDILNRGRRNRKAEATPTPAPAPTPNPS